MCQTVQNVCSNFGAGGGPGLWGPPGSATVLVEPSLELISESLQGPYPGPANKYSIQHQTCAFVSVHCRRPSAREATPPQGVA